MNRKGSCFISYCHEKIDKELVKHFANELENKTNHEIMVLLDQNIQVTGRINQYMDLISSVDAIVLLLTPEYNKRIQNRDDSGVYNEYMKIMSRYYEELEKITQESFSFRNRGISIIKPPLCLIPILFSGTVETSYPDGLKEIGNLFYEDFTKYQFYKKNNGEKYIPKIINNEHEKKIKKIADVIMTDAISGSNILTKKYKEYRKLLFIDTKHDWIIKSEMVQNKFDNIFVETKVYNHVVQQDTVLIVGRKGSGKTTLPDIIYKKNIENYKALIRINVNNINLEQYYNLFTQSRFYKEKGYLIDSTKLSELVWEIFIFLMCLETIFKEYEEHKLSEEQNKNIAPILAFILKNFKISTYKDIKENKYPYLSWTILKLNSYLENVINDADNDEASFYFNINNRLNTVDIISSIFNSELIIAIEEIINNCHRRFFISFDGFDTYFEKFRISTMKIIHNDEEKEKRRLFEIDLLKGFVHIAIQYNSSKTNIEMLKGMIDFCVLIPKERFHEIKCDERDSYIYINKYIELKWSCIELVEMLCNRLEIINDIDVIKLNYRDRLNQILTEYYKELPKEIEIELSNGKKFKIPFFLEILRHTFWRPREVLIYFSKILALIENSRNYSIEINESTISRIISNSTRDVIKTEFIMEFRNHCTNLEDILCIFKKSFQFINYYDLVDLIGDVDFVFFDKNDPIKQIEDKIHFLYSIGFIGVEVSKQVQEQYKMIFSDMFAFNEVNDVYEIVSNSDLCDTRFVIHPLFYEYLNLKSRDEDRIALWYNWDAMELQDSLL